MHVNRSDCQQYPKELVIGGPAARLKLSEGAAVWCNFGSGQPPIAAPKVVATTVCSSSACNSVEEFAGHGRRFVQVC